jgi:3',5'-nucleoside bisphosphate phosphatase
LKHGIHIDFEYVKKRAYPGSIGRPHIAHILVELGQVRDYNEAFELYLGDNCPCHVPKYKISPHEAIQLIQKAGGISFLAHPGTDLTEACIVKLINIGLQGIETVHPRHSQHQIDNYRKLINKYNLLECGGSDCHGNGKEIDVKIGKYSVPYKAVHRMKEKVGLI